MCDNPGPSNYERRRALKDFELQNLMECDDTGAEGDYASELDEYVPSEDDDSTISSSTDTDREDAEGEEEVEDEEDESLAGILFLLI